MKVKECCMTCAHHTAVLLRVEEYEGMECPVFDHFCDGKRINDTTVKDFRCGLYTERTMA